MYITINDIKGEKTIGLSYPIHSGKETPEGPRSEETAVIRMLSNSVQYQILKLRSVMDPTSDTKR